MRVATALLWGLEKRQRGGSSRLCCGADAATAAPSPPLSVEPDLSLPFFEGAPPAPSGSQDGVPVVVAMKEPPAAPGHIPYISHPAKSDPVSC